LITSPFPTDASFEQRLYEAPVFIMRITGYLAAPNKVIFEGLEHTMRYLYVYRHVPILYPRHPLDKKYLAMHWGKGSAEYISPKFGTVLVHTADANNARDIRDPRSFTSSIHPLNGVTIAWKCKKQAVTTLHSTGSEIAALTSGIKKTNHLRDLLSSLGYPVGDPAPTFEENQETIKAIRA
jgi:hypothetical protein